MTMLTKLKARNFKCFEEVEITLGSPVMLIGPNNSGKTTVLQALALWTIGLQRWQEKRSERQSQARKRRGVTINRQDLLTIPRPTDHALAWLDTLCPTLASGTEVVITTPAGATRT